MVKLDLYAQYYYEGDNDLSYDTDYENNYDTDYDQLKLAFEKLSELDIRPGREFYSEYFKIKTREKIYRERMLNGTGMGDKKGNFCRVG